MHLRVVKKLTCCKEWELLCVQDLQYSDRKGCIDEDIQYLVQFLVMAYLVHTYVSELVITSKLQAS